MKTNRLMPIVKVFARTQGAYCVQFSACMMAQNDSKWKQ